MNILMPQLGETVAEGKITVWFKTIGDAVKPGDNLFEIETDKVSMEVPATAAGKPAADVATVNGKPITVEQFNVFVEAVTGKPGTLKPRGRSGCR